MKVREKLQMHTKDLMEHGPITVVAFGDSVTHGCVGAGEIDFESVYHHRLAKKLAALRPFVPINVINAGIGGVTAKESLGRMETQVFSHTPDLVIVAFGLNDVNQPLSDYLDSLRQIFTACQAHGAEAIFLTPNMLNTYVRDDTEPRFLEYAHKTADYQNSGRMDAYMSAAVSLAREMGIKIADCYAEWKRRAETEDTTALLANGINHPTREMHELFADKLLEQILQADDRFTTDDDESMYQSKT